ncbi:GIY-YIG nuclease family protein [Algoriphagus kandeliae]|uniref:GIY-YIG nuclease family protein n=1 Tax=Algoriphagus kandeliae TaxID=2562278 RepID=A0A4Y9QRB4_9BACT|nr:GIY-YIG nuclease family protein [Algoriphagus kandeliae]TFV93553.1 GIY-YIG nuclease family protein [Algoriphagus kandeliae]
MEKGGAVYIKTNSNHTVLYTGVTSDLLRRVHEHKTGLNKNSFTSKYKITKLVFYESFHSVEEAINREKQIKGGNRKKKESLINIINPEWKDLWDEIREW